MQDPRNLSWFDFNQSRRFPLLHTASAVSRDGHFMIPDDLLVGLYLSYGLRDDLTDPGGFYIGRIVHFGSGLTLALHYRSSDRATGVLMAETTILLSSEPQIAALLGYDNRFFAGTVLPGGAKGLEGQPVGVWEFDHAATAIDPFCIRPIAAELSALYVRNADKTLGPFHGHVTLAAGDRIRLTVRSADDALYCLDEPPSGSGTEVVIEADARAGNEGAVTCLQTLEGVEPDENGDIHLTGRSCLEIVAQADQSTILLTDTCAEPCCTCKELAPVEEKIEELDKSVTSLESHLATLSLQAEFLAQSLASIPS